MKNLKTFLENSGEIIDVFNEFILEKKLQNFVIVDHICFKCESEQSFDEWRKMFEWEAKNLYQAIISGRRIATVVFKKPIRSVAGDIKYLELSDYKPNTEAVEGFDHIEFFPKNKTIPDILKIFEEKKINFIKDVKPHITQYIIKLGKYNLRLAEMRLIDKIKKEEFI